MKNKAVTLIEILLAVMFCALLINAIMPFIRNVSSAWESASAKTEILQNARVGFEAMSRYIRQAPRITNIPGASGDTIKIRDRDDTYDITFFYDSAQKNLMLRSNESGADIDSLLASGADSLTFDFFKNDGISPAVKASEVKYVRIQMQLSDSLGGPVPALALNSAINLRQDVRIADTATGAVWFADSANVGEFVQDLKLSGFSTNTNSVSVNTSTGECWVADTGNNRIKKLSAEGDVLLNLAGFRQPNSVSVNTSTGECWVADTGNKRIKKISPTGNLLINVRASTNNPQSVSVDSFANECWVADTGNNRIKKLSSAGAILVDVTASTNSPQSVSVNPSTGECWVADTGNNRIKKLSSAGAILVDVTASTNSPQSVSVNPSTGECWVADTGNNRIKKLSSAGAILVNAQSFNQPQTVSVNFVNGECWIADTGGNRAVRLNSEGDIEFDIKGLNAPSGIAVRP